MLQMLFEGLDDDEHDEDLDDERMKRTQVAKRDQPAKEAEKVPIGKTLTYEHQSMFLNILYYHFTGQNGKTKEKGF